MPGQGAAKESKEHIASSREREEPDKENTKPKFISLLNGAAYIQNKTHNSSRAMGERNGVSRPIWIHCYLCNNK